MNSSNGNSQGSQLGDPDPLRPAQDGTTNLVAASDSGHVEVARLQLQQLDMGSDVNATKQVQTSGPQGTPLCVDDWGRVLSSLLTERALISDSETVWPKVTVWATWTGKQKWDIVGKSWQNSGSAPNSVFLRAKIGT